MFLFKRKTPQQTFWAWFAKNESWLFDFEREQDAVFAALKKALSPIHPDLAFEIGPKEEGRREFVLSAGGITSVFPAVEGLVAAAPAQPRWTITAFRPRRAAISSFKVAGTTVDASDVCFCLRLHDGDIALCLFMRGYDEARRDTWGQIGFLMLDQALGERDVSLKIGPIAFVGFDAHPELERFPLAELPARFDEFHALAAQRAGAAQR